MQKKDFLNVDVLKESLLNRRVNEDREAFKFNLIQEMVYEDFVAFSFCYDSRRVDFSRHNALQKAFLLLYDVTRRRNQELIAKFVSLIYSKNTDRSDAIKRFFGRS